MSLILEALKKSEAERQRGKVPGLFVEQTVVATRRRRGTPAWVFGLGALLVLVAAGAVWWGWSRGADMAGADAGGDEAASLPAPTALPPLPPAGEGRGEGAPGASIVAPTVAPPPPQPSPARVERRPDEARVPAPTPGPAPMPVPAATPAPAELPAPTNSLPRLTDLPAGERNTLPPLKITMHVFADEPAQRFVILDGRRQGEGAAPADGVVIKEIRRDGLVLSLNGRDVLVPRP